MYDKIPLKKPFASLGYAAADWQYRFLPFQGSAGLGCIAFWLSLSPPPCSRSRAPSWCSSDFYYRVWCYECVQRCLWPPSPNIYPRPILSYEWLYFLPCVPLLDRLAMDLNDRSISIKIYIFFYSFYRSCDP